MCLILVEGVHRSEKKLLRVFMHYVGLVILLLPCPKQGIFIPKPCMNYVFCYIFIMLNCVELILM
jgi:hypothetical protein